MNSEIIAVGTELLLGEIANTNAVYLSKRFAELGINVYRHTSVGDNLTRVKEAIAEAFARANIVVTTGGLGPTADDITKEAAAEYFGLDMELHEPSLAHITGVFARIGYEMKENNKRQAYFPSGAIILDNPAGTAPGCIINKDDKICILLPGPPKEVSTMYERHVQSYLRPHSTEILVSRTLRFVGLGESAMEDAIKDIIQNQTNPTIAPYAVGRIGEVTLRISAKASDEQVAEELIKPVVEKIMERVGKYVYGMDDDTLAGVIVSKLKEKGLKLAAAESITGGAFASAIIGIPGASEVFDESCVTYSNESKTRLLGVKEETLRKFGAVSAETAEEMAAGAAKQSGADLAISFTGIAGPGGGSDEKPIGLMYMSLYFREKSEVKKHMLFGDRNRIRDRAVALGFDMIRQAIV